MEFAACLTERATYDTGRDGHGTSQGNECSAAQAKKMRGHGLCQRCHKLDYVVFRVDGTQQIDRQIWQ